MTFYLGERKKKKFILPNVGKRHRKDQFLSNFKDKVLVRNVVSIDHSHLITHLN